MKIYSLTGPSGTGKSYQAPALMAEKNIETLIDDGLLIHRDVVEAGVSAKRQKTKAGAIKTALFVSEKQAKSVKEKIKEINPEAILILGTSDAMVDRIATRLELGEVTQYIHIEDITTEEEREEATKSREQQGKHVIPVPTLQLKRDFAGYFMDPQKLKLQVKDMTEKAQGVMKHPTVLLRRKAEVDKTVVRPTYSYLGDFIINEKVIKDIALCVGKEVKGISNVVSVFENTEPDNLKMIVVVDMDRDYGTWETALSFQKKLTEVLEEMTAFNVVATDVEIRRLV